MTHSAVWSVALVSAAAVVAPLLAELLRRWRIPSVLFELLLGILIGPALLGWVEVGELLTGLSQIGLAILFFMAGYEINFAKLRGAPLNHGAAGWVISLVLGLGVGAFLAFEGVVLSSLLIGLALTSTAIGTLLPMLRDRGMLETRFGSFLTAAGAVGEFGPILAVTLLLSASAPPTEALLLVVFAALAVGVASLASRPQRPAFIEMMQRNLSTSTQLPVRIILLLITALVVLAVELGLDNLLGAFAAGMIARLALSPEQNEALSPRLEAIGFGFLIPVFFIVSGITFDLDSLLESPSTMVKVPIFLGLMLLVRGLPAMAIYRKLLSGRERTALMLLQSTALPMMVVITEIGRSTDQMTPANAAALVGAGMASVLIFPLLGFAILGSEERDDPDLGDPTEGGPSDQTLRGASDSFGEL